VFVKQVPNGKLYTTGGPDLNPNIFVTHLYGSPYEMGYAHGQLFQDILPQVYSGMLDYIYNEVESYIKFLPQYLQEIIAEYGVYAALEGTYYLTSPFIEDAYVQEVQGIADAININAGQIMRVLLFPELIQAGCSMMGAYGESIVNTNGTLFQLRALDWDTDTPLQQWPMVLVYHPTNGNAFATLTWAGFTGALTGWSQSGMSICEKVWISYKGKQNRAGIPFHFLLRDILQFDTTIDAALARIWNATRTCSIWIGLGDSSNTFNAVSYSYQELDVYNDYNRTNHTSIKDVVYVDKHVQPSSDPCMPDLINEYYGNLTAENIFRHITAEFQTGDMHFSVFDHANKLIYVANASPYINGTAIPAYNRQVTRLDLNALFNEPAPSQSPVDDEPAAESA